MMGRSLPNGWRRPRVGRRRRARRDREGDGLLTGLYHTQDAPELGFVYRCTASGAPQISPKADAARYFDPRSRDASLRPNHAKRVHDGLGEQDGPVLRDQPTYESSQADGPPGWTAISGPMHVTTTEP